MPKLSAGLLLYRFRDGAVDVLIGHPGGPFWARKDDGAWSIPKGEYTDGDDPWAAARREFTEEIGLPVPDGPAIDIGSATQPSGKVVTVFAVRGDLDITEARSNTFELEWPKGSGTVRKFPEVDRVGWFPVARARVKLVTGQRVFLDRLMAHPAVAAMCASAQGTGGSSAMPTDRDEDRRRRDRGD
ncbi:NUDIX domain-containing protein [Mycobacterium shinjukuense]|uniref:NUDIX domain-containing protein n=1 Tax=Mycobacterium shinjukuense TaxID=398694 RepID=A0A7I7MVE3_9MYCO|nr:NUDIX domain-containing protein [Mycobacterium shinjukuense]BBX75832.1 NUDIX domain-containing protein [Mycobacterium shinjukuense]